MFIRQERRKTNVTFELLKNIETNKNCEQVKGRRNEREHEEM